MTNKFNNLLVFLLYNHVFITIGIFWMCEKNFQWTSVCQAKKKEKKITILAIETMKK